MNFNFDINFIFKSSYITESGILWSIVLYVSIWTSMNPVLLFEFVALILFDLIFSNTFGSLHDGLEGCRLCLPVAKAD